MFYPSVSWQCNTAWRDPWIQRYCWGLSGRKSICMDQWMKQNEMFTHKQLRIWKTSNPVPKFSLIADLMLLFQVTDISYQSMASLLKSKNGILIISRYWTVSLVNGNAHWTFSNNIRPLVLDFQASATTESKIKLTHISQGAVMEGLMAKFICSSRIAAPILQRRMDIFCIQR